jgi:hypothetical protein
MQTPSWREDQARILAIRSQQAVLKAWRKQGQAAGASWRKLAPVQPVRGASKGRSWNDVAEHAAQGARAPHDSRHAALDHRH